MTAHAPVEVQLVDIAPDLAPVRIDERAAPSELTSGGAAVSRWCRSRSKRAVDVALSVLSLPVVIPVMAVAGTVSFVVFRRQPFFVQQRRGLGEEVISVLKIRSLPPSFPEQQGKHEFDEQELFAWSRFLRRSHFDELPQIFNVIGGSMSIVGPRPMIDEVLELLEPHDRQMRALVRPGLTGPWQSSTMGAVSLHDCPELDAAYVHKATWRSDARIVMSTVTMALGRPAVPPDELLRRLGW